MTHPTSLGLNLAGMSDLERVISSALTMKSWNLRKVSDRRDRSSLGLEFQVNIVEFKDYK